MRFLSITYFTRKNESIYWILGMEGEVHLIFVCIFDKVFASFWRLTLKTGIKKMHVNWHTQFDT